MRISDWSSDVCSSDLALHDLRGYELKGEEAQHHAGDAREDLQDRLEDLAHPGPGVLREVDRRPEAQGCSHRHGDHGDEQGARHDRRSEERRVGKEGGSTCRSWGGTYH